MYEVDRYRGTGGIGRLVGRKMRGRKILAAGFENLPAHNFVPIIL
jgi:hypothetical protein